MKTELREGVMFSKSTRTDVSTSKRDEMGGGWSQRDRGKMGKINKREGELAWAPCACK